ncbi:Hypothetical predicted protein [Olea europaea subsp. europaea]|uniref:Uncharacterized protein n=1 Tax=Olea europaea subsp. europaea TaxID=158383 RepID=A0A8S0TH31_OLEEU|nr:Hypothetical predicted protein [Olea europaea subsp. europaea]
MEYPNTQGVYAGELNSYALIQGCDRHVCISAKLHGNLVRVGLGWTGRRATSIRILREKFKQKLKSGEMNPNEEESSINATRFVTIGSVFPKQRENVSTMAVKKIAEAGKKAVDSAVDAVKKHKDKAKISPDS